MIRSCPTAVTTIKSGCFFKSLSPPTISITLNPSIFGIIRSSSTTSGCFSFIRWYTSSPLFAFPTRFNSLSLLIISPSKSRILSLSSAIATFISPIFTYCLPSLHENRRVKLYNLTYCKARNCCRKNLTRIDKFMTK